MRHLTPQEKEQHARAQRASIAVAGFTIWAILASLCVAAFWQHIDGMNLAYPRLAKLGAVASEVIIGFMVYWHCFNHHIGVRKAALWLGIFLSSAALVHAGALYGMTEAKQAQLETEQRVKEALKDMSDKQMAAARGKYRSKTQQEIAKNAQKEAVETIKGGNNKVTESSILPAWYLRGGMYAVLFILGLICSGICVAKMQNREDIDANFDGKPDHLQTAVEGNLSEAEAREMVRQIRDIQAQLRAGQSAPTKAITENFPDALPTGPLAEEPGKARRH